MSCLVLKAAARFVLSPPFTMFGGSWRKLAMLAGLVGFARLVQVATASEQATFKMNVPVAGAAIESLPSRIDASLHTFAHPFFTTHRMRVAEPKLCDSTVKQYSGYLDISETRHLFFWFFEARHSPETAPLMLWLNGGPGASSMTAGLLFENGPCFTTPSGNDTVPNPYSWNEHVNIIYLDEPIGTGFSFASDGSMVISLKDLAIDVYAFLQVFMHNFPQYASLPFHIAAESWGGHYGPEIGNLVYKENKRMEYAPFPGQVKINLASIMLANGLTEPLSQFETIPNYMCGGGPYPPYEPDHPKCTVLRLSNPPCLAATKLCYRFPQSTILCDAAFAACWQPQLGYALGDTGKNPYDLRKDCEPGTETCYAGIDGAALWLNRTDVKIALGVDPDFDFHSVNRTVNSAFYDNGQAMLNSAALLPELVNDGVRLLAFAGDTDGLCNYMGVELWMQRLEHVYHTQFEAAPPVPWKVNRTAKVDAGTIRAAGSGAGNVTFIRIFNAGHMAPHDQGAATLDMITRWVDNKPWV